MRNRLLIAILGIFLTIFLNARPTGPTTRIFTQPDGSTFAAQSYGDEFCKITTTSEGHAIIRDDEGWWCYAAYDSDGSKYSSGCRIGENASAEILARSLSIPFDILRHNARLKKYPISLEGQENIMKRVRKAHGVQTKGDSKIIKHGIIILAQYKDVKFSYTPKHFIDLVTKQGYDVNGGTGCIKDYFESQFNGMYGFEFDVSDIVTLSRERKYYGQNDKNGDDSNPAEMIEEACRLADLSGIDFSLYDDDGDRYVDNIFVFFAGEDEADTGKEECIWSHSWYVKSGAGINVELDGVRIDQYACTSELITNGTKFTLTGIGTFCHEFSHTLGLPDFYDTDYDYYSDWSAGLWHWTSLMDGGNANNNFNTPPCFNAIEREIMGLTEPINITRNGSYTLYPIHSGGNTYRIPSDSPEEYYLLECRANQNWDRYIRGNGMLVYHIDKTDKRAWEIENTVNMDPWKQYADLIEADGRSDFLTEETYVSQLSDISGIFFPHLNSDSISADSSPGISFRNGSRTSISITGIRREGENITFTVSGLKGEKPPIPVNIKWEAFMDAAILNFESDKPFDGSATVEWGRTGQKTQTSTVAPYEIGKYALVLEDLIPGNRTYNVTISFESNGISGESKKISFMTTKEVPVSWPYIHFGKAADENGTFSIGAKLPMRVYNASEAEAIEWEFNGKESGPEGDGYLTVSEPGILRATVYWPDGSTDILEKNIMISE